jgi:hypothetical protein
LGARFKREQSLAEREGQSLADAAREPLADALKPRLAEAVKPKLRRGELDSIENRAADIKAGLQRGNGEAARAEDIAGAIDKTKLATNIKTIASKFGTNL